MERGGRSPRQTVDDQQSFEPGWFDLLAAIPILDAESVDQPLVDECLQPGGRRLVQGEVGFRRWSRRSRPSCHPSAPKSERPVEDRARSITVDASGSACAIIGLDPRGLR